MSDELLAQVIIAASTLFAVVFGYLMAGINDALRDRRNAQRDRLARQEERRSTRRSRQHELQLETLLCLQDALQTMARLTGRAMHFDHMQARQGKYTQLPEGYSEDMHANGVEVVRLRNRVLDDDLRAAILSFESASAEVSMSPKRYEGLNGEALEDAATLLMATFSSEVTAVMDHLGRKLRDELAWIPEN